MSSHADTNNHQEAQMIVPHVQAVAAAQEEVTAAPADAADVATTDHRTLHQPPAAAAAADPESLPSSTAALSNPSTGVHHHHASHDLVKENVFASHPVYLFLAANALLEQWPVFEQEGYELVEDLQELVLPANKDLFERLVPKSGHRLRMSRLLCPAQIRGGGGSSIAGGLIKPSGRAYAASSRSTLLGDTDDENLSVADSIVSYTSRATMHAATRGGMITATNLQQQQHQHHQSLHPQQHQQHHDASLAAPVVAQLPRVVSYPMASSSLEDMAAAGQSSTSTTVAGGGGTTAGTEHPLDSYPPTPSPSPQRTDFQRTSTQQQGGMVGAPVKSYATTAEGSQQQFLSAGNNNNNGSMTPRGQSADTMSVRTVASKSPMRQQRQRAPSDAGVIPRGVAAGGPSAQVNSSINSNNLVKMKVVVVGQQGCGKTSLIHRLVRNEFTAHMKPTIGVEFAEKRFQVGSTVVALHFWDIWGQEMAANATRTYYTGAKGAIVVYDASNEDSLQRAMLWKRDLDAKTKSQRNGLPIPVILVANKCDLVKTQNPATQSAASNASLATAPSQGSFLAAQARQQQGNGGGTGILQSFNGNDPSAAGGSRADLPSLANFARQHSASSASLDRQDGGGQHDGAVLKTKEEIQDFCNEHRFSGHFFTSAKTGESVRGVAEYLVLAVLKMEPLEDSSPAATKLNGYRPARVVTLDNDDAQRKASTNGSGGGTNGGDKKKSKCTML